MASCGKNNFYRYIQYSRIINNCIEYVNFWVTVMRRKKHNNLDEYETLLDYNVYCGINKNKDLYLPDDNIINHNFFPQINQPVSMIIEIYSHSEENFYVVPYYVPVKLFPTNIEAKRWVLSSFEAENLKHNDKQNRHITYLIKNIDNCIGIKS